MTDSIKLHTHCPTCQAPRDYDTQGARHYTCGTYGRFLTGVYVKQCSLPRVTCTNCDAMTRLVEAQAAEIKRLHALLEA